MSEKETVEITKKELDSLNSRLSHIKRCEDKMIFARESFSFYVESLKVKYTKLSHEFVAVDFDKGTAIFEKRKAEEDARVPKMDRREDRGSKAKDTKVSS